ncbi:Heavy metal sensor histidine kinase [Caballeronia sordidicola]|uniref:Heavy metal sensor histidine kinase n=1 Tax=Caballeronia sordidicola TaxID=196367 RepID=A0A242N612_CABSO|nr:Heavy metal sensor histidine kinase [Caballeronia sordidicola]
MRFFATHARSSATHPPHDHSRYRRRPQDRRLSEEGADGVRVSGRPDSQRRRWPASGPGAPVRADRARRDAARPRWLADHAGAAHQTRPAGDLPHGARPCERSYPWSGTRCR